MIIYNLSDMNITIGKHIIGPAQPTFVIAEAGVNHNGSLHRAKQLIIEAAKAGADAVKFQTYKAEKLVVKSAPRFWKWDGEKKKNGTQYDSYAELDKFPLKHYPALIQTCREYGVEFLSTPFDEGSADALIRFGMKAIKVSSSDITNTPFLSHLAKSGLPILLSTGASSMGDIEEAVETIEHEGNSKIILLQCTLIYPTPYEHAHLRVIPTLTSFFPTYTIGLSDHTLGTAIPLGAVALGAHVIEKHFTVDKTLQKSADHWLSVDPAELANMVRGIRQVEAALGEGRKYVLPAEKMTHVYDKRSLVAACRIPRGTVITEAMLTRKRPGTGIRPKDQSIVIGRKAANDIEEDTTVTWDMV